MNIYSDDELAQDFLAESRERLVEAEHDLLALETAGANPDPELVNRLFRAFHSVKGGAGFFGLVKIGALAHRAEDVLGLIRDRRGVPSPGMARLLLRAADQLTDLIEHPANSNQVSIADLERDLAAVCDKTEAPADSGKVRMLLVEDDFASRLLLQRFLGRYGECHVAVNGREAVEAFRAALQRGEPYQLVCMDIMMPEMDGREAIGHLRAVEEAHGVRSTVGAKIVMTTAIDDIKTVTRCFLDLCDAYLTKPIDLAKLRSLLQVFELAE